MAVAAERPEASIEPMMLYMGRLAREAAGALALAPTEAKNRALEAMAARIEANAQKIIDANVQDLEAARGKGRDQAFLDRLMLDPARVAAMAKGLREVAALRRSGRPGDGLVDAAERLADFARARAARRDRHHLRVAPQRDGRRRRALPQIGQRRDPAQRVGELPHLARHRQHSERGRGRGGPAAQRPSSSCRRSIARRSASCCRASAVPST